MARLVRRGQAALEFLTTYGWAFLVILVMIGALAYFGILSPDKFLPERCTFPTELPCRDSQVVASTNIVSFYVANNLGEKVTALNFTALHLDSSTTVVCAPSGTGGAIEASAMREFTCTFAANTFNAKTKTKLIIDGNYTTVNGKYLKSVSGEIYAKVK